jgi:hypothetical protein
MGVTREGAGAAAAVSPGAVGGPAEEERADHGNHR